MIKKLLTGLGVLLLLVIALLVLIPYLYKDEIIEYTRSYLSENIEGSVTFSNASVSLIKDFPNLHVGLSGLSISGRDSLNHPLYKSDQTSFSVDLISLWKKDETAQIGKIFLDRPVVNIFIDSTGSANYSVISGNDDSDAEADDGVYDISFDDVEISDGNVKYLDETGGIFFSLNNVHHKGNGRYLNENLSLKTATTADSVYYIQSGNTILKDVRLDANVEVLIDLANGRYEMVDNDVKLNELNLNIDGEVAEATDNGYDIDLKIKAPGNRLRELLSIIPNAYTSSFNQVKAGGSFDLIALIKGRYDNNGQIPEINIRTDIKDGRVKYPDLPKEITDILASVQWIKPQGVSGESRLNIDRLKMRIDQSNIDAKLNVDQGSQGNFFEGYFKGDIMLEDFANAFPIETEMKGNVQGYVSFASTENAIRESDFDNVDLSGNLKARDVNLKQANSPVISLSSADIVFKPEYARASNLKMQMGKSDLEGEVELKNPLSLLTTKGRGEINTRLKSNQLDLNEWMSTGADNNKKENRLPANYIPDNIEVNGAFDISHLEVLDYKLDDIRGSGKVADQKVKVEPTTVSYQGNTMIIEANLDKVEDYLNEMGSLQGFVGLGAKMLDLDEFMADGEMTEPIGQEEDVVVLPKNMNLKIGTNIDELKYGNLKMRDLKGTTSLKDQIFSMENITTKMFGGDMKLVGQLESNGKDKPLFDIKYDILKMPFKDVYDNILSVQQLAPIAKFIEGIFNSTLIVKGELGKGMMPNLENITASGYIETLNGQLGKLPFLEKLSDKIKVKVLKGLDLENTKNWFDIENGTIKIQPFEYQYDDIKLNLGGSASMDKTIDINMIADIPKDKFDKVPGTDVIDEGMKWMNDEASKLGFSLGEIKSYKLGIDMVGDYNNPKYKIKLLSASKGAMKEVVKEEVDKIKEKVRDTIETRAKEEVEKVKDTLKSKVQDEVDKAKEKAKEKLDTTVKKIIKKEVEDKLEDEIKDKLKDWNPFKKKK